MNKDRLLIPFLRFNGFDENWEEDYLNNLGIIRMCKRVFKNQTSQKEKIPFFTIKTLGKNAKTFISESLYKSLKEKYNYPILGQTLITCSGTIGKTIIFNGVDSYFQDSNIVWFDFDKKNINQYFFKLIIDNQNWNFLTKTTISRLYNRDLYSLLIQFPSILEQQKIASLFVSLDNLIEYIKIKINKLKNLKESLLTNMFVDDIDETPGIRFKGFNEEWEISPLSNFTFDAQIKSINNDNFLDSESIFEKKYKKYVNQKFKLAPKDSIVFIKDGFAGTFIYSKFNTRIASTCDYICSTINNLFLFYLLENKTTFIKNNLLTGDIIPHLYKKDLLKLIINIPHSLDEQQKISHILKLLDEIINHNSIKLNKLQNIKLSLLDQMFVK